MQEHDLAQVSDQFRKRIDKLSTMDNKQFYWIFHSIILEPILNDIEVFSNRASIIDELQNRLVPEYDGETCYMTKTGWVTPDGAINYIEDKEL